MNKLNVHESYKHKLAKELVFEWLTSTDTVLIDQFKKTHVTIGEFIAIESPVTTSYDTCVPYHDAGSCEGCFPQELMDENYNFPKELYSKLKAKERITGKMDEDDIINGGFFKLHRRIDCPFNKFKYKFIFDIGMGSEATYHTAVEITNTSKVTDKKLLYCIRNRIDLFEVQANAVLRKTKRPKYLKCKRLWWMEDDKYYVADSYSHLVGTNI